MKQPTSPKRDIHRRTRDKPLDKAESELKHKKSIHIGATPKQIAEAMFKVTPEQLDKWKKSKKFQKSK